MYEPMMCRNASVGRRILLPEVFEGKPAVVVYEAFVSTLPLRRLCGVLIQAGSAYTRPSLLRCEVTFLSPTQQHKQKTEVNYCNITHTISSRVGGWIVFPCRTRRTRLDGRARPNLVVARSCFSGLTVLWTRSDRPLGPLLRSSPLFSVSEHFLALPCYPTFAICLCYGQFYVAPLGCNLCRPLTHEDSDFHLGLPQAQTVRLGCNLCSPPPSIGLEHLLGPLFCRSFSTTRITPPLGLQSAAISPQGRFIISCRAAFSTYLGCAAAWNRLWDRSPMQCNHVSCMPPNLVMVSSTEPKLMLERLSSSFI